VGFYPFRGPDASFTLPQSYHVTFKQPKSPRVGGKRLGIIPPGDSVLGRICPKPSRGTRVIPSEIAHHPGTERNHLATARRSPAWYPGTPGPNTGPRV